MPIVDVRPVLGQLDSLPAGTSQALADAIAAVLGAEPARVWVRVTPLRASDYAENGAAIQAGDEPVFVEVLHADLPDMPARAAQARLLSQAIAARLRKDEGRVHLEYAAAGRGRIAFGGQLVA